MSLVRFRPEAPFTETCLGSADLAHLVERDLAKVEVAGSSPVIRSNYECEYEGANVATLALRRPSPVIRSNQ